MKPGWASTRCATPPSPNSPASACSNTRRNRTAETTAAAKVLIDKSTDQIVGAHLLGPEYGELINTIGLAMKLGLTTRQLKSATAVYPTVGSDLAGML